MYKRQFLSWLQTRETVPVIRSLRDNAERTRRHEMEHALKLLAKGEDPASVLDHLSHRLTNKFLHAPTQALNQVEGDRSELQMPVSYTHLDVYKRQDRIRYLSLDDATPLPLIIEQHTRIVDGIEAGNPTTAAAAMRTHLREIIVSLPDIAARFPDVFE